MLILLSGGAKPVKPTYADALAVYGAQTRVIYPGDGLPEDYDALLFTGGADIHPARFGMEPLPNGSEDIDPLRDDHEFALFAKAWEAGKPILGICRGMQVINVALGGDLWQDLPSQLALHHSTESGEPLTHTICWTDGRSEQVNSYHHQSVKTPGQGLIPAAHAGDGVIEALYHESYPLRGVQWHPERMERAMDWLLQFTINK